MSINKTRVCIFGTSANPPTNAGGHAGIVSSLASLRVDNSNSNGPKQFDEIRVLPVYKHMFSEKRDQASFDHRLEMCRIAFKDIPNVRVSDEERKLFQFIADKEGTTELRLGTYDLLQYFHELNQSKGLEEEYTIAMGTDTFMDLTAFKWKKSKEIIKKVGGRFVIKLRGTDDASLVSKSDILERIETTNNTFKNENKDEGGVSSVKLDVKFLSDVVTNVSSSKARETCDEDILASCLDPHVIEYIKEKRLYNFSS